MASADRNNNSARTPRTSSSPSEGDENGIPLEPTAAPPQRRHAFRRASSGTPTYQAIDGGPLGIYVAQDEGETEEQASPPQRQQSAKSSTSPILSKLGSFAYKRPQRAYHHRSLSSKSPQTPQSTERLLSHPEEIAGTGTGTHDGPRHSASSRSLRDTNSECQSNNTSATWNQQSFLDTSDVESLGKNYSAATTAVPFKFDGPGKRVPDFDCRPSRPMFREWTHWLYITLVILAIYSTIFSGIYLTLALKAPRYGRAIRNSGGNLTFANASLLSALFAKTIELSFVTVFVACLGQLLSRRAFMTRSRGVTIAEMSLRSWIMQPGTLLTHPESVRYAGLTWLGAVSLIATIVAMLYTTASDALVAPKLKLGNWEPIELQGLVKTKYANTDYVQNNCRIPSKENEPVEGKSTCIQVEHASQAYHNYYQYLQNWETQPSKSANLSERLNAVALLYDTTTVEGSWIHVVDMEENSKKWNRTVTNVTLAMPHNGVFAAAKDPFNKVMQPEDLDGLGEFSIRASVPSPTINVVCAHLTKKEFAPLLNDSKGPPQFHPDNWLSPTEVDDLFEFGEKYGRRHPIFPRYPDTFQTEANYSIPFGDTVYLAGKTDEVDPPYMLCSMRSYLSPHCSTQYDSSLQGGTMKSRCEDDSDDAAYSRHYPDTPEGEIVKDWSNVATDWAMSLALNDGSQGLNTSNSRVLTQLMPAQNSLDPARPSTAEALAAMAGCTLLVSAQDAQFLQYWNYSEPALDQPIRQAFHAFIQNKEYASGGAQTWQKSFHLVLLLLFLTNVCCLCYLLFFRGLVTDYTDPTNLFTLALNSPPDQRLAGSCGGGPTGRQYRLPWFVHMASDHFFFGDGQTDEEFQAIARARERLSPVSLTYQKLTSSRSSYL